MRFASNFVIVEVFYHLLLVVTYKFSIHFHPQYEAHIFYMRLASFTSVSNTRGRIIFLYE
nr:MAG TPA: hypothetical protein [Caudoviricetes sp.]